jgi:periplasmic protein TonB
MFSTLETTWDRSARRGWTTFASFTFQALALSLLLLIPLFSIQGPPRLEWLRTLVAPTRQVSTPPPQVVQSHANTFSNVAGNHILMPTHIPQHAVQITEVGPPPQIGVGNSDRSGPYIPGAIQVDGPTMPILAAKPPAVTQRQFKTSTWAEGNLVRKVQPTYPPIARAAHIQGLVQLHAIISKEGTIENLIVESGHPMLVKAALDAVSQWRYRPYLLNHEPVEVETEITVNFTLGGS